MKFRIIVKANAESEAGVMPQRGVLDEMADYPEERKKARALRRTVIDGPFTETKELIGGYTSMGLGRHG